MFSGKQEQISIKMCTEVSYRKKKLKCLLSKVFCFSWENLKIPNGKKIVIGIFSKFFNVFFNRSGDFLYRTRIPSAKYQFSHCKAEVNHYEPGLRINRAVFMSVCYSLLPSSWILSEIRLCGPSSCLSIIVPMHCV